MKNMRKDNTKKENPITSHHRLAKFVEVLDKLNRIYGIIPVPTKNDANKEHKK